MLLRDLQIRRTLDRYRTPKVAAAAGPVPIEGVVAVEGEAVAAEGGHLSVFEAKSLRWPDDPVPLIWDREDGDHTGMIVGTMTRLFRRGADIFGSGALSETDDPETAAAVRRVAELVADGAVGFSVQAEVHDGFTRLPADAFDREPEEQDDGTFLLRWDGQPVDVITDATIRHVAIVDTAAFVSARPARIASAEPSPLEAVVAAVTAPLPSSHYAEWRQDDWQPLTFEPDGRVWGHAAGAGCHRSGVRECWLYPGDVDPTMAGFHTGATVPLDDGTSVRVGPLTFGGLHADPSMSREQARRLHEDASTVVALVRAFEDHKGRLAITGTTVPGLDEKTRFQIAGTAPSVELWPEGSGLTLIGLHLVPVPGLPVAASVDGGGVVAVTGDDYCECECARCGRNPDAEAA